MSKTRVSGGVASVAVVLLLSCFSRPAGAGTVVTDGTLGRRAALSGPHFSIGPELGQQRGGNLFHSFSSFDLARRDSATFTGPGSVHNVFARVTGGEPSSIDGTLRCSIPDADFYFINPAGVVFGRDATLDLKGSFVVTTADYARLGPSGRFSAVRPSRSVLTADAPTAFGFLGRQAPGAVIVNGTGANTPVLGGAIRSPFLQPAAGKALLVVAGPIVIHGGELAAKNGVAGAVSVASAGEVMVAGPILSGSTPAGTFSELGQLEVTRGGFFGNDAADSGVRVVVGTLTVRGSTSLVGNITGAFTPSSAAVDVNAADQITLSKGGAVGSTGLAAMAVNVTTFGPIVMDGGSIESSGLGASAVAVTAASLSAQHRSSITSIGGDGFGAPVTVRIKGDVNLKDSSIQSFGLIGGSAPVVVTGRNIAVNASTIIGGQGVRVAARDALSLSHEAIVGFTNFQSQAPGVAGPVSVSGRLVSVGSGSTVTSTGGPIAVKAIGTLNITSGARIDSTSNTPSRLLGVRLSGADILIDGQSSATPVQIRISGTLTGSSRRPGGDLSVIASNSLTVNDAAIAADSFSSERAGSISLQSPAMRLSNGSVSARSFSTGTGGAVGLSGRSIALSAMAVSADSFRGGNQGGRVTVDASGLFKLGDGSSITARSGGGLLKTLAVSVDFAGRGSALPNERSLSLVSPRGTVVALTQEIPLGPTTFLDTPLVFGSERPIGSLSNFTAADLNGTWSLSVRLSPRSPITLKRWSLMLGGERIGGTGRASIGTTFQSRILVAGARPGITGGNGGDVIIHAASYRQTGSSISAATIGSGKAGSVGVTADSVSVTGGSIESKSTLPPSGAKADLAKLGAAGSVTVSSRGSVSLVNDTFNVTEDGPSAGGNLSVKAGAAIRLSGTTLSANAIGNGGDVTLASPLLVILREGSRLVTNSSDQNGGNISVDPIVVSLDPSSQIRANGGVNGGKVNVSAVSSFGLVTQGTRANVTATGGTGVSGTINTGPANTDIARSLARLSGDLRPAALTLQPQCGQMLNVSTFLIQGRGATPQEAGFWNISLGLEP